VVVVVVETLAPNKGRLHRLDPQGFNRQKHNAYGLENSDVNLRTGIGFSLDAAISSAIRQ